MEVGDIEMEEVDLEAQVDLEEEVDLEVEVEEEVEMMATVFLGGLSNPDLVEKNGQATEGLVEEEGPTLNPGTSRTMGRIALGTAARRTEGKKVRVKNVFGFGVFVGPLFLKRFQPLFRLSKHKFNDFLSFI